MTIRLYQQSRNEAIRLVNSTLLKLGYTIGEADTEANASGTLHRPEARQRLYFRATFQT